MTAKPGAKKDLFQYLELYKPDTGIIPLSMGAPGPSAMKGCSELLLEATRITLVSLFMNIVCGGELI